MAVIPLVPETKMADVSKLISLRNLLVRKVTWFVLTTTSATLILSRAFEANCMTRIAFIYFRLPRTHSLHFDLQSQHPLSHSFTFSLPETRHTLSLLHFNFLRKHSLILSILTSRDGTLSLSLSLSLLHFYFRRQHSLSLSILTYRVSTLSHSSTFSLPETRHTLSLLHFHFLRQHSLLFSPFWLPETALSLSLSLSLLHFYFRRQHSLSLSILTYRDNTLSFHFDFQKQLDLASQ